MKKLLFILVCGLAGCASAPEPYDQQFSTMDTVDANGVRRSHAWVLGPSATQRARFKYVHGKK